MCFSVLYINSDSLLVGRCHLANAIMEKNSQQVKLEQDAVKSETSKTTDKNEATKTEAVGAEKTKQDEIKNEKTEPDDSSKLVVEKDPLLDDFYSEIDTIKTEDFKTNSKEQLDRLLRPGSTYFNLNPFEVLQIDPYATVDEIKKKYRKLSIYIHPDKNPDDRERAQIAFEAVNRAYKLLENEKERKQCLEVVDEARVKVEEMCEEKRKKLRKELAQKRAQKPSSVTSGESIAEKVKIDEDDPDKYRHAIYVMTCKLFADIERLKVREAEKQAQEKKRKAEERSTEQGKAKIQKEWDKNYEESRQARVNSWQSFMNKKGPSGAGSKLPKFKPEKR